MEEVEVDDEDGRHLAMPLLGVSLRCARVWARGLAVVTWACASRRSEHTYGQRPQSCAGRDIDATRRKKKVTNHIEYMRDQRAERGTFAGIPRSCLVARRQ